MRIKQQMIEHAKMTTLDEIVKAFDILLISESKLDNTFPINHEFSTRD